MGTPLQHSQNTAAMAGQDASPALKEAYTAVHDFLSTQGCKATVKALLKEAPEQYALKTRTPSKAGSDKLLELLKGSSNDTETEKGSSSSEEDSSSDESDSDSDEETAAAATTAASTVKKAAAVVKKAASNSSSSSSSSSS